MHASDHRQANIGSATVAADERYVCPKGLQLLHNEIAIQGTTDDREFWAALQGAAEHLGAKLIVISQENANRIGMRRHHSPSGSLSPHC
jgi:hypothetical protein